YRKMMAQCGSDADEDGIPYSLYAAERLIETRMDPAAAREFLAQQVTADHWRAPLEAYLIRSLVSSFEKDGDAKIINEVAAQVHDIEQVLELAKELPKLQAGIESVQGTDSAWIAFGAEPWLVTVTPPAPPVPALVFVISSTKVAPPGTRLIAGQTSESAWLGY